MMNKESIKQKGLSWCKYVSAFVIFAIPLTITLAIVGKMALAQGDAAPFALYGKITLFIAVLSYYILTIALAAMNVISWKLFLRTIKEIIMTKIQYTFPLFIANILLISLLFYFIFLTLNAAQFFTITVILSIIWIILLVFLRLLWISFTQKIIEHE